jgi:DNA polymerase III sliding clamp (beta) subunit (PCNA family)
MQFSVDNKLLGDALKMSHALTVGLTHTNCVFRTGENQIIISAASGDCWIKTRIPATIKESGEFCTKAEVLASLRLKGKDLSFTLIRPKLLVKSGRAKIELSTFNVKDARIEPPKEIPLTHVFEIDAFKALVESMKYDSDVVESIDIKPINIRSDGEYLKVSTNDLFTMGNAQVLHGNLKTFSVTVPGTTLFKLLPYIDKNFKCGISETAIRIKCDNFDLTQNYLQTEKKVIDIDAVLKMTSKKTPKSAFFVERDELLTGLEEVASFTNKETLIESHLLVATSAERQKIKLCVANDDKSGKINSVVNSKIKSDDNFKVSLYLFREFIFQTKGKVEVRHFGDKLWIGDKDHTFIMPTLQDE